MEFTQENFEKLQADLAAANSTISALNSDITTANDKITTLQGENINLQSINDKLVAKFDELSKVEDVKTVADLEKKIENNKTAATPESTFEVDGESYRFICPVFTFKKERIVAADVINDQAKLTELVKAKVGTIQKV